jgi:hypothetical protein
LKLEGHFLREDAAMDQDFAISEMGEKPEIKGETLGEEVTAQEVNISHSGVRDVRAATVTLRQSGAHSVTADHLTIRQGGAVKAEAEKLEMIQGCLVAAKTQTAKLNTSMASLLVAQGDVQMEQSGAQLLLAKGEVKMDQSGAVILVSRSVKAEHSGATFLIAREVEGDLTVSFGPRESFIFGTVAGLVGGLTYYLLRRLLPGR